MSWNWLNDYHHWLGRWLRSAWYWHRLFEVTLVLLVIALPLQQFYLLHTAKVALMQEQQRLNEELNRQQRIVIALRQQSTVNQTSPQLANQLLPINQQIEQLRGQLDVMDLRWEFLATPRLHLSLVGRFNEFQHFIDKLLNSHQQLRLEQLHLQKAADSAAFIRAELIFRLHKELQ